MTKRNVRITLQIAWLLGYLVLFMTALSGTDSLTMPQAYQNERLLMLGVGMAALAFPMGLLWLLVVVAADSLLGLGLSQGGRTSILLEWGGVLILGYIQWFWLLPRLIDRFRRRPHEVPPSTP